MDKSLVAMGIFRAILITLVAVSIAMLPVAGSVAQASAHGTPHIASQSDCCTDGEPCEKQMPNKCGQTAECMLKCFNFSGALVASLAMKPAVSSSDKSALVIQSVGSPLENPPLPPPRV